MAKLMEKKKSIDFDCLFSIRKPHIPMSIIPNMSYALEKQGER